MKRILYSIKLVLRQYFKLQPFAMSGNASWFISDYLKLKRTRNPHFELSTQYLLPCITDKTAENPMDYVYFYQNAWAAGRIFSYKPSEHFDIGSQVGFVGILAQFVKTTFIDIRTIDVNLPGLHFQEGDILKLPYPDASIESVSSICVVEHIGLGRYGDALNANGSEEAIAEIIRVTKPKGNIVISVPIDTTGRIYFNAHRAFTRELVMQLFAGCDVVDEQYIYGSRLERNYDPQKGFGTGLYHFQKR